MTAVTGILNKNGVALAAESAITVSGFQNRKVYNSANKIFTLSKYQPVGIAIYNDAHFMGIPWEIIIKEYREKIDKQSFDTLKEYRDDFFSWLKSMNYFTDDETQRQSLLTDLITFTQIAINDADKNAQDKSFSYQDRLVQVLNDFLDKIQNHNRVESLKDLKEDETKKIIKSQVPQIIEMLKYSLKEDFEEKILSDPLVNSYYEYLKHDQFITNTTGLIFTGYGKQELFPRLLSVEVSFVIHNQLRYRYDTTNDAVVSNNDHAFIKPFAQTDVINTILQGISPQLQQVTSNVFKDFIQSFINQLGSVMPEGFSEQLNQFDVNKYVNEYQSKINDIIKKRYVTPLMDAVSQLSKEDLAEMVESLVYLTYLKKRFTMAEESVGGPVDVAVITKGDGFIWIKRKHYFDPELNPHFFQKYF
jgi:hypothetical protein